MKLKILIPAALVAAVTGVVARRLMRKPKPVYKTIADIKAPMVKFQGYDPSKMGSLFNADVYAHREKLVAHAPLEGGKRVPRESGSFDCPAAAGL